MNSYFMQREGGRLYRTSKTDQQEYAWCDVCTERVEDIRRQPHANIFDITDEVYIKVV
jgi:hypothetical protein